MDKHNPEVDQKWIPAGNLTLLKTVVNTYEDEIREENSGGKKLKRIGKVLRETLEALGILDEARRKAIGRLQLCYRLTTLSPTTYTC